MNTVVARKSRAIHDVCDLCVCAFFFQGTRAHIYTYPFPLLFSSRNTHVLHWYINVVSRHMHTHRAPRHSSNNVCVCACVRDGGASLFRHCGPAYSATGRHCKDGGPFEMCHLRVRAEASSGHPSFSKKEKKGTRLP